jgi:hypothetical protein
MAASRHHLWQKRWTLDESTGTATHETGLICRHTPAGVVAENGPEIQAALAVKNGHGNAPKMLQRMLDEAAAIFRAGSTFRARL